MRDRHFILFFSLLPGCLAISGALGDRCQPDDPAVCQGNTLLTCQDHFLVGTDCGASECIQGLGTCGFCGDSILNNEEACDDADQIDTNECKNDCTLPRCGDGLTSIG